jgi:Ca-activated chloride channel homolog
MLPTNNYLSRLGILALTCLLVLRADERPDFSFRVDVDMVVLTFTVTDANGKHVSGLKPEDLRIREDGVDQKIIALAEGTKPPVRLVDVPQVDLAGAKVFILFDTSNWMYSALPYTVDAIAEFVRGLDDADSIAVYTFSRNLFRAVPLTKDRDQALSGVRRPVVGDDTALYNTLLLTLRDAAKVTGRKAVVVFSNGRDNASIVAPDDVGAVAEDTGVPIYFVSTLDAVKDQISANAFQRLVTRTGGQLFWARTWQSEAEAFMSIREDLASSYTAAYYPSSNTNEGFRKISVDVRSDHAKKYRVRTRLGYRAFRNP